VPLSCAGGIGKRSVLWSAKQAFGVSGCYGLVSSANDCVGFFIELRNGAFRCGTLLRKLALKLVCLFWIECAKLLELLSVTFIHCRGRVLPLRRDVNRRVDAAGGGHRNNRHQLTVRHLFRCEACSRRQAATHHAATVAVVLAGGEPVLRRSLFLD
jgi:hypothetical protein